METEGSLPSSQELATCPYSKPEESNQRPSYLIFEYPF